MTENNFKNLIRLWGFEGKIELEPNTECYVARIERKFIYACKACFRDRSCIELTTQQRIECILKYVIK